MRSRHDKDFVEQEILKYGSTLLNKNEYIGCMDKNLKITCPDCGKVFITSYYAFMKHNGQRCPECTNVESHGEYEVRMFLEQNGINYIPQYRFNDCKYKNTLPFDFYLPDYNVLIEYDGEQHYKPVNWGCDKDEREKLFKLTQIRDQIKTEYCKNNNIKLIRIPYYDFNNISTILSKNLL